MGEHRRIEADKPSRKAATAGAVALAVAGAAALTWFASRATQSEIDARTRRRLMPLTGGAGR